MTQNEALTILTATVDDGVFEATASGLAGFVKTCRAGVGIRSNVREGRITAECGSRLLQSYARRLGGAPIHELVWDAVNSGLEAAEVAGRCLRSDLKALIVGEPR